MTDFDARAKGWDDVPGRRERANAVAESIREQVRLTPQMSALEYGCGTGLLSFELQPYLGKITLADSSPGMLEVLREKISSSGVKNIDSFAFGSRNGSITRPTVPFDLLVDDITPHP